MAERHQFRANWHEYNEGLYFITVCCAEKLHYFGEIKNGKMEFSPIGVIAERQIKNLPVHFSYVEIWNHVVMPNHIHLVIMIDNPAGMQTDSVKSTDKKLGCLKPRIFNAPESQDFHHNSLLSVVMRCLTGGITRDSHRIGLEMKWQPRYHDNIILDQRSYDNIMHYIDTNVENWCYDRFHPTPKSDAPWDNKNSIPDATQTNTE